MLHMDSEGWVYTNRKGENYTESFKDQGWSAHLSFLGIWARLNDGIFVGRGLVTLQHIYVSIHIFHLSGGEQGS